MSSLALTPVSSDLEEPRVGARQRELVSVVVPVVERPDDLVEIYDSFSAQLLADDVDFEFCFVFDGAAGPPPASLLARGREDPRIRVLCLDQAFGEATALRIGFQHSRGSILMTVPAYFQVRPEGLSIALQRLRTGVDLVVTRRYPRADGWINRMQSRAFHWLVRGSSGGFRDMACGVRAMRRELADSVPLYGDMHRFFPALALRAGYRVAESDVPQHPGDARRRLYRPGVYLRRLLDIMTFFFLSKFTEKPLRFFGLVGTFLAASGVLLSAVLLVQRLLGEGLANRPLLLAGVLLIALGVQLTGLGLVGEIIVHVRSPSRRSYRVREVTDD